MFKRLFCLICSFLLNLYYLHNALLILSKYIRGGGGLSFSLSLLHVQSETILSLDALARIQQIQSLKQGLFHHHTTAATFVHNPGMYFRLDCNAGA